MEIVKYIGTPHTTLLDLGRGIQTVDAFFCGKFQEA